MIDKILGVGGNFDWISPLWSLYQDSKHGGGAGFTIDVDGGWSLYAVNDLMTEHGIETWGWFLYDDVFIFRLDVEDAPYAQSLMLTHGVAVCGNSGFDQGGSKRRGKGLVLLFAMIVALVVLVVMFG